MTELPQWTMWLTFLFPFIVVIVGIIVAAGKLLGKMDVIGRDLKLYIDSNNELNATLANEVRVHGQRISTLEVDNIVARRLEDARKTGVVNHEPH